MSITQLSLLALLHRANQIATERFEAPHDEGDMTLRQLQVLAAIEANTGASQSTIVDITGIDRSTLAEIVRRLQKQSLIERRRSKADARAYVLKLTDVGRRALANGKPAFAMVEKNLLAALPASRRGDLLAMLGKIVSVGDDASSRKRRS